MRASIFFNSLTSRIDEQQMPEMRDTFDTYLGSSVFYDSLHDYEEENLQPWCGDSC